MKNNVCLAYIYAPDSRDRNLDEKINKIDFCKLTHIAIAFSQIKETDGFWTAYVTDEVRSGIIKIMNEIKRQNADTKVLLSVGGAGADGFCQASQTKQARKKFADSCLKLVDEFELDGIDLDWEFPGESVLKIQSCKHCKKDFLLLLDECRRQLKMKLLTIAVGSNRYFGIDVKNIGRLVDYVFVMTYDLGPMHSNIFLSKAFTSMWNILGVAKNKICIGVPFYGRNVKDLEKDTAFNNAKNGKITYFLGQSFSDYYGNKYCFDTPSDVLRKGAWASRNGFGGIFCWEITGDCKNQMLTAMSESVK